MSKIGKWVSKIFAVVMAIAGFIFMVLMPPKKKDDPLEVQIEASKKAEAKVKGKIEDLKHKKTENKQEIDDLKKELEKTQAELENLEKSKTPVDADEAYAWLKKFARDEQNG